MALSRRTGQRFQGSIWPGFVDAMTALLLVLMFVLTIFMVVQSVLRETITGQESRLDELTSQVLGLASALGLEQTTNEQLQSEVVRLSSTLVEARNSAEAQANLIATLSAQTEAQSNEITSLSASVTSFEAQVATLLAQRDTAIAEGSELASSLNEAEQNNAQLLSDQEALNLALATARQEIDQGVEEARLAAAKREALEALIVDLQTVNEDTNINLAEVLARLTAEETRSAELVDNLSETRTALETSETALATTETALATTETALATTETALATTETALATTETALATTETALATTETELETSEKERLAELAAAEALRQRLKDVDTRLTNEEAARLAESAAALALRKRLETATDEITAMSLALEAKRKEAEDTLTLLAAASAARADLDAQLEAAQINQTETESGLSEAISEAERQKALLKIANELLATKEAESADSMRRMTVLNEQVAELRSQLGSLQDLLDASAAKDSEANIQLQALGAQLNTALARVASEEKKRSNLEEAERKRLEAEAEALKLEKKDLARYRSEFFGRLRDLLGTQDGVRIEGDRFVFSSEVLFETGAVDLSDEGKIEVAKVAGILKSVADQIPPEIDWVIRVDGHTDDTPLFSTGKYQDNWELSQGRALSVVRYMVNGLEIPPGRLAANGFGEFQPVNTEDTPEARAQNRRIELKFTEK